MRLIDADALIQLLRTCADDDWNKNTPAGTWSSAYEEMILHVEDAPTIEKKAKWIPIHKGERGFSAGDFRCSVCHQPNKCYTMTNYCSHCGAYMKPTEKNDQ